MSTEIEQRAAVVAAARAWKNTPYHMNAKIRGVGVDCGQRLICAFRDAGLTPDIITGHGLPDFHLNRKEERYMDFVRRYLTEIAGPPEAGDVMLFHYGHSYSHGGIVVEAEPLTIVHALIRARKVIEQQLTKYSQVMANKPPGRPPPKIFTLWPKFDRFDLYEFKRLDGLPMMSAEKP